jgi:hypothetical protein
MEVASSALLWLPESTTRRRARALLSAHFRHNPLFWTRLHSDPLEGLRPFPAVKLSAKNYIFQWPTNLSDMKQLRQVVQHVLQKRPLKHPEQSWDVVMIPYSNSTVCTFRSQRHVDAQDWNYVAAALSGLPLSAASQNGRVAEKGDECEAKTPSPWSWMKQAVEQMLLGHHVRVSQSFGPRDSHLLTKSSVCGAEAVSATRCACWTTRWPAHVFDVICQVFETDSLDLVYGVVGATIQKYCYHKTVPSGISRVQAEVQLDQKRAFLVGFDVDFDLLDDLPRLTSWRQWTLTNRVWTTPTVLQPNGALRWNGCSLYVEPWQVIASSALPRVVVLPGPAPRGVSVTPVTVSDGSHVLGLLLPACCEDPASFLGWLEDTVEQLYHTACEERIPVEAETSLQPPDSSINQSR